MLPAPREPTCNAQIEAGHGCPITMTFAAVPSLRTTPELAGSGNRAITARIYDPRNAPDCKQAGVTIGVRDDGEAGWLGRARELHRAYPIGAEGPGAEYELVGHKYFVSAHVRCGSLVLARAPPPDMLPAARWRPDSARKIRCNCCA